MSKFVVGHKNPDTDSVVSALVYAELFDITAAVAGTLNNETEFLLNKLKVSAPGLLPTGEKEVVLVDTNGNPEEMPEGLDSTQIAGIVDHHKLGGLKTAEPIPVTIKTVGSTATLIGELAKEGQKVLTPTQAGLLLGAIISDTLKFSSPTTTETDREAAKELAKLSGLEIEELAQEMFAAKSDISGISTGELLNKDYKVFEMGAKKVGIGVWETTLPELIMERKAEILKELASKKTSEALDYVFFFCIDIVKSEAIAFLAGDPEASLLSKAFEVPETTEEALLAGVVSRKKQIAPKIEKAILE